MVIYQIQLLLLLKHLWQARHLLEESDSDWIVSILRFDWNPLFLNIESNSVAVANNSWFSIFANIFHNSIFILLTFSIILLLRSSNFLMWIVKPRLNKINLDKLHNCFSELSSSVISLKGFSNSHTFSNIV